MVNASVYLSAYWLEWAFVWGYFWIFGLLDGYLAFDG
jgi:hypothetical protein